jgi:hypothetical protein
LGIDDAEDFLDDINGAFQKIPAGLSFGDGERPFSGFMDTDELEQIATVGGLVARIEQYCRASTGG